MGKPNVVCLCGSTRFKEAWEQAWRDEGFKGQIVLSVVTMGHHELPPEAMTEDSPLKRSLDLLHFYKIDLADEILVLNVNGYIGHSTKREIGYSVLRGKGLRFLNKDEGEAFIEANAHEIAKLGVEALERVKADGGEDL